MLLRLSYACPRWILWQNTVKFTDIAGQKGWNLIIFNRFAVAACVVAFSVTGGLAQQNDIKPKFGKPPPANTTKRITVFIEPVAPPEASTVPEPSPDPQPDAGAHAAWFWGEIPPRGRDGFAASDLDAALRIIQARAPQSIVPTAQDIQDMVQRWNPQILMSSGISNMSPALVAAVMWVESRGKSDAISPAAAQGLMQLIPATADRFGVADPFDPLQNVTAGARYLAWLLDKFQGDPILMLAGYNAGENAVIQSGGVPDYAETRNYVPKVLAAYSIARMLCKTPPILVTDGCVFQLPDGQ